MSRVGSFGTYRMLSIVIGMLTPESEAIVYVTVPMPWISRTAAMPFSCVFWIGLMGLMKSSLENVKEILAPSLLNNSVMGGTALQLSCWDCWGRLSWRACKVIAGGALLVAHSVGYEGGILGISPGRGIWRPGWP